MRTAVIPLMLLPGIALADVTLYGSVQGSLGRHAISQGASQSRIDDTGSSFGAKGNELLGSGLKTIWQIEFDFGMDGTKEHLGLNETFVGIEDPSLGKLRIGNLNNALKDMTTLNQWKSGGQIKHAGAEADKNYGADALTVFTNPAQFLKNAIRYDTPSFGGFSANLAYGFGENRNRDDGPSADRTSVGLRYQTSGWFAAYAYLREQNPCGTGVSDDQKKHCLPQTANVAAANLHYVEGGYRDDHWLLALALQQARGYDWSDQFSGASKSRYTVNGQQLAPAEAKLRTRQAALSLAYTTGAFTPKLTLARGWDQQVNGAKLAQSGYRQWIAGVDYALSKRTTAGLAHGRLTFDQNANQALYGKTTQLTATSVNFTHKF
ncbi:MAG: porin [Paludibacterium sp.]|uniref:porin n=1 Tax=Paludibacterium sp. TaxID=1917523 RepID=UPI0025F2D1A2|nr:porin [Paludibacterium sp.]MBV8047696.1 porin [Paludibacterium sp.]MBV8649647.1 porin [Paludibacterium sp.]